ncbi:glycosyltransferase family A protein [Pseudalkalibacillus sp. SCS-8]|uniref:glycosyltransferase family 2 protein n=1 Tax=Pseudalkalibacillus nanhaiensis TaxID=3115291 RepID=UPI0032DB26CF
MKTLTVFTPTYNRAYCLHKCYESLKRQTCKDFKWLIVDDGSTDRTKALVSSWQEEDLVEIIYVEQENMGMHGAHNTAYEIIDTELNVCVDSDDYLTEEAVEKILSFWKESGGEHVGGIMALNISPEGRVIGTPFPASLKTSTLYDLYQKHHIRGDKKLIYRTELTKRYPYPIFGAEKYVGLDYKYLKLDQEFELLVLNEAICVVEYQEDGSSKNMLFQYRNNPRGFSFYRKELMKLPFATYRFKLRQSIHYVSSSLLDRNSHFIKESPSKFLTLISIPFGLLLYYYIISKTTIARKEYVSKMRSWKDS